jgi:hypothetical protein
MILMADITKCGKLCQTATAIRGGKKTKKLNQTAKLNQIEPKKIEP